MTTHRHEVYRKIQPGTLWPAMGRKRGTTRRYTLRMVPVADIVRNLDASVDYEYVPRADLLRRIVRRKVWDESTWALVDHFLEGGAFAFPICIVVDENDDSWMMGNGHHRLVAEILTMAHDSIPVLFALDGGYMHDWITSGYDEEWGGERDDVDPPAGAIDTYGFVDTDTPLASQIEQSWPQRF